MACHRPTLAHLGKVKVKPTARSNHTLNSKALVQLMVQVQTRDLHYTTKVKKVILLQRLELQLTVNPAILHPSVHFQLALRQLQKERYSISPLVCKFVPLLTKVPLLSLPLDLV